MVNNNKVNSIIVTDFENNEINLINKYQSKNLLIIIYRNQCLGCAGRAIPLANDFQNEFKELQVIGIHTNFGKEKTTKEEVGSIFREDKFPFPIYVDEKHEVFDQFESQGTPQWLIITPDKILYRSIFGSQTGEQNRIKYSLEALLSVKSQF